MIFRSSGMEVSLTGRSNIDWPKAKAAGIQFAFIKATQGDTILDLKS